MSSRLLPWISLLLMAAPLLAEAQPRPLRVSQLLAEPEKYHGKEVVLRAYFETDISHWATLTESRAIDEDVSNAFRADKKDADSYQNKYCLNVINKSALYNKFGQGYAANKHTVSVRGIFIPDAGQPIWGCRTEAAFQIIEPLRKED